MKQPKITIVPAENGSTLALCLTIYDISGAVDTYKTVEILKPWDSVMLSHALFTMSDQLSNYNRSRLIEDMTKALRKFHEYHISLQKARMDAGMLSMIAFDPVAPPTIERVYQVTKRDYEFLQKAKQIIRDFES